MRKNRCSLYDITDAIRFKVIVDTTDNCYRALGVLHQTYRPIPGNFSDYIALPKENGYQSLHITLFGPKTEHHSLQIRTEDMEKAAQLGVACHLVYKTVSNDKLPRESETREWLEELVKLQQRSDSTEFLETVKLDLSTDRVVVFTPRGDVERLPIGATALDFAYAVDSNLGNCCAAVKVDHRLVPLRTQLYSGQTVEVIAARGAKPNASWLNFVVTVKARNSIRQYLSDMRRGEAISLGRQQLEAALQDIGLSLSRIDKERMSRVLADLDLGDREALFEQVGTGALLAPLVASRLTSEPGGRAEQREKTPIGGNAQKESPAIEGPCIQVTLTIDGEYDEFSREREASIVRALHGLLGEEQPPRVAAKQRGSIRLTMEMSPSQFDTLTRLYYSGELQRLGITLRASDILEAKAAASIYDVFLCHCSSDKRKVRQLAERLIKTGIRPWFDEWELQPGVAWRPALESAMAQVRSAAVIVGRSGTGPWQEQEIEDLVLHFVERSCPVIPVLLKSCRRPPKLPRFLGRLGWVDFRRKEPDPYGQLCFGITGQQPNTTNRESCSSLFSACRGVVTWVRRFWLT